MGIIMNNIQVKNLNKTFGEKKVLDNIKLSIEEGEIFGLLGPSGAGKTTLIKILTGQISYQGEAKIFGEDCKNLGNEIYQQVGMVLDNSGIYDRLSCYENVKLFADIYKVDKKTIHSVLKKVGLLEAIKTPSGKLSKGMKQRLLLARAVLHSPKVLFLDEPTSGLDPATTQEIHKYLLELKSSGTTIFLTTHNMDEAYKMCDHIALLNEGHIVEYGIPDELCRKYNLVNRIQILLKSGERVEVVNDATSAERIFQCFKENNVEAIHSSEPNLETVFMKLTGRGLGK
ncbi:MAG: ABC transporter ATP-binding protein [Lachnospiraceae bacterium]|nr:ABC transporter ATP-binding protein [Lachnospiraceae bacterium]